MSNDENPTSFDSLAHEHNLSARMRDLCRLFFTAGLKIGRRQSEVMQQAQGMVVGRAYHHVIDRDTVPGEFR